MRESEHTPGPWEVLDRGPTRQLAVHWYDVDAGDDGRGRDCGHDICDVTDVGDDAGEANAYLIAAAPELYAMLAEWRQWYANAGLEPATTTRQRYERTCAVLDAVSPPQTLSNVEAKT